MNEAIGTAANGIDGARPSASVLIVDDSDVVRESLSTFIAAQPGLRVIGVAASGTEALHFLGHTKVDVVLTDLNMPGIGGLELTRRIKEQPNPPCVIVISVQNVPLCRMGAQEAGADGFVAKSEIGVCLCPMLARLLPRTAMEKNLDRPIPIPIDPIQACQEAEEKLRRLNAELEQRVRQRTAQLEEANQELDAFAHSVSHDLRAPVRGIVGFGEILGTECRDALGERGRHYLDRIMEATRQMQTLIEALLQLAHANRSTMRRQTVDLSALAGQVAQELREAQPQRPVPLTCTPGLVASGDERLLRVVLVNLLGNAWKYTGKVAAPQVEFGMMSDEWRVTSDASHPSPATFFVRDNGAGFDMQYVDRLFGTFQRLHSMAEFEGTGVGLATVQRIIHRHGGKIWGESKVGEGATFYFTLPDISQEPPHPLKRSDRFGVAVARNGSEHRLAK